MSRKKTLAAALSLLALGLALYQLPPIKQRLSWRIEIAKTYLRGVVYPAGPVPTALPASANPDAPTAQPSPSRPSTPVPATAQAATTPQATSTGIPAQISLPIPEYEQQTMNNCGPATLTMALRYYGWDGDQTNIAGIVKPIPQDRNVNPEEMAYYVRNYAGWLRIEYRLGGTLAQLKKLLAAGYPVIVEEAFHFEAPYWPNDDLWAAHYLLLTGYDDASQIFTGQDSFYGPNKQVAYARLEEDWLPFNNIYMIVYLPDDESELQTLLGDDWDEETNRQNALQTSLRATETDPNSAYAWFNLGTNLLAVERYAESAQAYNAARELGLPQRMMRYQFGPFIAYFQANQIEELLTLSEYALQRTPNSEEALLWHGWALYRQGDINGAIDDWLTALKHRPGYIDAQYALDFVR